MAAARPPNDDSNREYFCPFCKECIPTSDHMRTHLNICGSKTEQCPNCKKYIQRSIFTFHIDNNCTSPNFFTKKTTTTSYQRTDNDRNPSSNQIETNSSRKFDPLFEQTAQIPKQLGSVCYQPELDHVIEKLQFNILVMGSPRVGKSSLINALCDAKQAETSASLDSCTQKITCYSLKDNKQRYPNVKPFQINFYDTPGIETWEHKAGELTMVEFIEKTNPLCIIYCASPGTFASLKQLHATLEYCKTKEIFCALVCTNMWMSGKRHDVIKEFEEQLAFFGPKKEKNSLQNDYINPHKVTFFGKGALCTMVNSMEYSDKDLLGDKVMPVQGIDELIHGIMQALDQEKLLGWCYAVLYRRSYWEKIKQNIGGFFQLRFENMLNLIAPSSSDETAISFADYFLRFFRQK